MSRYEQVGYFTTTWNGFLTCRWRFYRCAPQSVRHTFGIAIKNGFCKIVSNTLLFMRKIFTTASSFSQQNKRLASVLCFIIFSAFTSWSQEKTKPFENDLMYPPTEAAKPCIDYDGAGFTVNGQRTYLSSGSIHYPRVPQELWFDRLLRIKRGNFAAVQTYTFWNFHEPQENQFDFSGDKDFGKFLDTAQELGLYATVRIGPYVCAEWDSGGYPLWLKFKPSFKVRTDNRRGSHGTIIGVKKSCPSSPDTRSTTAATSSWCSWKMNIRSAGASLQTVPTSSISTTRR